MMPTREDFTSHGVRCAADLWLPDGVDDPPVVVMGHGFAALRTFAIPAYAERFVADGLAVLTFDYRGFGDSDGEPRQLVDHRRHLEDWQAALAHVRALPQVDGSRVALWGSSYGGGHVLTTAARDHQVAAVVAQVPFVDGLATLRHLPASSVARLAGAGLRDAARMVTRREPHHVAAVGRPGETAAMNTPDAWDGYLGIVPDDAPWENRVPARVALTMPWYRPTAVAGDIRCPVQVLIAEDDSLIPAAAVERLASRIRDVEVIHEPYGHFDVYDGPEFEAAVARQSAFLVRHLAVGRG